MNLFPAIFERSRRRFRTRVCGADRERVSANGTCEGTPGTRNDRQRAQNLSSGKGTPITTWSRQNNSCGVSRGAWQLRQPCARGQGPPRRWHSSRAGIHDDGAHAGGLRTRAGVLEIRTGAANPKILSDERRQRGRHVAERIADRAASFLQAEAVAARSGNRAAKSFRKSCLSTERPLGLARRSRKGHPILRQPHEEDWCFVLGLRSWIGSVLVTFVLRRLPN